MTRKPKPSTKREPDETREHREDLLDEALEESFPASDTPSMLTRSRKPKRKR